MRGTTLSPGVVLLLIILGIMSQCQGYLALEAFAQRRKAALIEALNLPIKRLPSNSTSRLIVQRLDYELLLTVFSQWAKQSIQVEPGTRWSMDGKCIADTLVEHKGSQQNFGSLVSLLGQKPA